MPAAAAAAEGGEAAAALAAGQGTAAARPAAATRKRRPPGSSNATAGPERKRKPQQSAAAATAGAATEAKAARAGASGAAIPPTDRVLRLVSLASYRRCQDAACLLHWHSCFAWPLQAPTDHKTGTPGEACPCMAMLAADAPRPAPAGCRSLTAHQSATRGLPGLVRCFTTTPREQRCGDQRGPGVWPGWRPHGWAAPQPRYRLGHAERTGVERACGAAGLGLSKCRLRCGATAAVPGGRARESHAPHPIPRNPVRLAKPTQPPRHPPPAAHTLSSTPPIGDPAMPVHG